VLFLLGAARVGVLGSRSLSRFGAPGAVDAVAVIAAVVD